MTNGARLEILGPFEFTYGGRRFAVPAGAQRLLALLAVHYDGIHRRAAAEQLWPDCTPCRAAANLRSALCQSRKIGPNAVVDSDGQRLALSPCITVDHREAWQSARRLTEGEDQTDAVQVLPDRLVADLDRPLLVGWDDEWLILERERWDQMRLYALEALAQNLLAAGRYLAAQQAALAATAVDPYRETAHRIAIEVHAAEGNIASAVKRYQDYRRRLQRELRVSPSARMTQLIRDLTTA
ncbi:DNA-binding SARP family transcriptional activator [Streptomyces phaeochromogenes]|uniref:AfsR/SARP family transcriptional regulator n=1 Tax=Streptomyces phaeochromogenes TaxID=1923 RepID=UPI00278E5857|nr:BTAD domain-containing putative transcriptional regulator [Streptomyces phaeochromogenes]MDQ0955957.1 DNA-binding SARP family transcriptional activator [Streptomyces phaeochromogenes]